MTKKLAEMTPEQAEKTRRYHAAYYQRNRERMLERIKAAQARRWANDPQGERRKNREWRRKRQARAAALLLDVQPERA